MIPIKARARQTIFDIAIQEHGTAEAAFDILKDNSSLEGITVDLPEGKILEISNTPENYNNSIKEYLTAEKIATGNFVMPGALLIERNYGSAYDPAKYS